MNDFSLLALLEPKRPPPVPRVVYVGLPIPDEAWAPTKRGQKQLKDGHTPPDQIERKVGKQADKAWQYPNNQVLTSKYNVITFLPKNLLEQFRRVANVFFLAVAILQFFPRFSNVSPALAVMPLLVVLAITALKDAYEDFKRHQSDRFINNIGCHVLSGPEVHNPNLTLQKGRGLSMRWLGDLFPTLSGVPFLGGRKSAKRAAKESEKLSSSDPAPGDGNIITGDDGATPDDFDADERASLAGGKRTWWGRRRRALTVGSNKEKKGGPPGSGNAPLQSVLFDNEEDAHHHQHMIQQHRQNGMVETARGNGAAKGSPAAPAPDKAHWKKSRWEDIRVGDFIRLRDNDSIPAGELGLFDRSFQIIVDVSSPPYFKLFQTLSFALPLTKKTSATSKRRTLTERPT